MKKVLWQLVSTARPIVAATLAALIMASGVALLSAIGLTSSFRTYTFSRTCTFTMSRYWDCLAVSWFVWLMYSHTKFCAISGARKDWQMSNWRKRWDKYDMLDSFMLRFLPAIFSLVVTIFTGWVVGLACQVLVVSIVCLVFLEVSLYELIPWKAIFGWILNKILTYKSELEKAEKMRLANADQIERRIQSLPGQAFVPDPLDKACSGTSGGSMPG